MLADVQFSYICGMKALRYGMPYNRPLNSHNLVVVRQTISWVISRQERKLQNTHAQFLTIYKHK